MNEQMTLALFNDAEGVRCSSEKEELCSGAFLLRGFVRSHQELLLEMLQVITAESPFRLMITPGGFCMSVALTNCGSYGWVSDRRGYRYNAIDPKSGKPWSSMPAIFLKLAQEAAMYYAGFKNYVPDACLVNRYEPVARLSLHQDRNKRDLNSPIVSVSLGIPTIFLWGGLRRKDKSIRILLMHGDVMVWGGPARLHYHGVLPIKERELSFFCRKHRINLTFRKIRLGC